MMSSISKRTEPSKAIINFRIVKEGISHVISTFPVSKLFSMVIHINSENIASLPFRVAPKVSDFLR